jgi:hypothetical protein
MPKYASAEAKFGGLAVPMAASTGTRAPGASSSRGRPHKPAARAAAATAAAAAATTASTPSRASHSSSAASVARVNSAAGSGQPPSKVARDAGAIGEGGSAACGAPVRSQRAEARTSAGRKKR